MYVCSELKGIVRPVRSACSITVNNVLQECRWIKSVMSSEHSDKNGNFLWDLRSEI